MENEATELSLKFPNRPPVAWSAVVPSGRRLNAIEGVMAGAAIGEALGLPRNGMDRVSALRMFGRGPLHYRLVPGFGWSGHRTNLMLMAGQSVLRSRSKSEAFGRHFGKRLGWLLLALPLSAGQVVLRSSLGRWFGFRSGVYSAQAEGLTRAQLLGIVLQGTGSRGEKWIQVSMEQTHLDPEAVHAGILLAYAGQLAMMTDPRDMDEEDCLLQLIDSTEDPVLVEMLEGVLEMLRRGDSVQKAARLMGWERGIPNQSYPVAVMGIYAFLRHSTRFRFAVERAVLLGGEAASVGAIAGALAGIHLGTKKIPPNWLRRLNNWPHGWNWMKRLAMRLTEWPHAVEDLHSAPALPSHFIGQLFRNVFLSGAVVFLGVLRLPWVLSAPIAKKSHRQKVSRQRLVLGRDAG